MLSLGHQLSKAMRTITAFLLFLIAPLLGLAQQSYPVLTEIVTDRAGIFLADQLEGLRTKLYDFEQATDHQLAVLAIEDLQGQTIEEYALGVFNQNKLGQAGRDNGILILFSREDREVRIEVGYGLEPHITDAVASRIIRNTMIPRFKEERYFEGIDRATDQIIEFLQNPEALAGYKEELEAEQHIPWWAKIIFFLMISAFMGVGGFVFYQGYIRLLEIFRGVLIGKLGVLPALPLLLISCFLIFFGAIFLLVPLGFVLLMFGLESKLGALGAEPRWALYLLGGFGLLTVLLVLVRILVKGDRDLKISWLKSDSAYMAKTFSSAGTHSFGSGSSSSSSGGSSSFSGGGGSSGGGGASGSW